MNTASTINLTLMIMVLLQQCNTMAVAEKIKKYHLETPIKSAVVHNKPIDRPLPLISLDLTREWGFSALVINSTIDTLYSDKQKIARLFAVDDIKLLQKQIDLRFQTGLYSLKNNYVLSPYNTQLLSRQFLLSSNVQNDLYQIGRLSTETGYSLPSTFNQQNLHVFVHSAYSVVHHGRFDLSLTASFQSIKSVQAKHGLAPAIHPLTNQNNEQATSTTFGIIGSYDLSERWSLIGALTASHIDSENINDGVQQENKRNMALIGTTYSF